MLIKDEKGTEGSKEEGIEESKEVSLTPLTSVHVLLYPTFDPFPHLQNLTPRTLDTPVLTPVGYLMYYTCLTLRNFHVFLARKTP